MSKYLVGYAISDIGMEGWTQLSSCEIIEAESEQSACDIFDRKHNSNHFYGSVIARIEDDGLIFSNNYPEKEAAIFKVYSNVTLYGNSRDIEYPPMPEPNDRSNG